MVNSDMTSSMFPGNPPAMSVRMMEVMSWYGVPLLQVMPTQLSVHGSLLGEVVSVMLGTDPFCLHTSGQDVKLYRISIWLGSVGFEERLT